MKPGDTIKRIKDPYSWAPLGFITKCCIDPTDPDPHLIDITKPYGSLGYTALDGSFVFIFQQSDWEVIDGEPPLYGKGVDYSAPDIVVPNVKPEDQPWNMSDSYLDGQHGTEYVPRPGTYEPGPFDQAQKLYDIVIKWRDENNVWDGEVIALYDHVRETFDDLVFDLIRTVGYAPYKDEEDQ